MLFLVHFQTSIVDIFGILAYVQPLIANNFDISANIQELIADDFGIFNTLLKINIIQTTRPSRSLLATLKRDTTRNTGDVRQEMCDRRRET